MRKKGVRYALTGIVLLFLCFWGKVEVVANPSDTAKKNVKIKESFYYALPQNYFTVRVVVDKISTYKAPLSDYANKITGLSSVIKEDAVYYVVSRVEVEEHASMDLQHVYYVEVTHKHAFPYYVLYKNLLLSAYNTLTVPWWEEKQPLNLDNTLIYNRFNRYTAGAMIEKYDTAYIQEVKDSVVVQTPKITKRLVAKPTQQQADETIKTIETIRETIATLISGENEVDYSKLDLMLSELQKKEKEYLTLFEGVTEKEELSYTFIVFPTQKNGVTNIPLFQFSQRQGISNGNEEKGTLNYTLRLTPTGIHDAMENADNTFAAGKAQNNKTAKNNSLYYRKPQYFTVSLYRGNDLMQDLGIYPISQFGKTLPLPANASHFEINPLTGSLNYIEIKK